jgi:lycopene beta-cyclase
MSPSAAPPESCDVLIAGGGLAGLMLAARLADEKFSALRVCVIEPRQKYARDRTWSYWRQATHALSHLERLTWTSWSVAHAGREICSASDGWVYASVDADAVYAYALQKIQTAQHVQLLQGWAVQSDLSAEVMAEQVATGQTHRIRAQRVVDARARVQAQASDLVQQFVGWEVECDQAVFKPQTVQLMHFETATQGLHFMYVLPYAAHRALIETTWISPLSFQPNFDDELRQTVQQRLGNARYEITYREQGSLSLLTPELPQDGVIRLGRSAAALRPSTGYAFLNTLAQIDRLLESWPDEPQFLVNWQAPVIESSSAQRWMDAVFLREMQSNWRAAPQRFMNLFAQVQPDVLLRFLSGQEGWVDRLAVMRALPVMPYMQAAWQHSMGRTKHA